jgi:serine/threonine protein kinase
MATPTKSVRDYCSLLAKSKLLPLEEIESLHAQWRAHSRGTDEHVESFRKFLVAQRALTEYQAALIQRGRADNFFLGGYKILDRIGKGQMGGVYKAVHNLGQIVALKILPASSAKNPHVLGRFQREARLLTQLDHPNVVRAFQVGESNGVYFIVMECLEGETLDEVLSRRKRLPSAEAARLVRQALGGLQHLHERRMVHRDLKPSNLMLTPAPGKSETTLSATVKILDIGLGRELFDEFTPEGQVETQLTVEGAVLGTPDYLAPEQARDARTADTRADLYSLGCVLYHCITGRPPFPDPSLMSQMLKHATEMPAPLASLGPDVTVDLQPVLDRMLAKSPNDRFATPAEAAEALARFVSPSGNPSKPAVLVPAYKAWLETESQLELPKNLSSPSSRASSSTKPGTQPASPIKTGTSPSPAHSTQPATVPASVVGAQTRPERPLSSRSSGLSGADEINVELVKEEAFARPVLQPVTITVEGAAPETERGLLEFDRRDWIMLAAGAVSVLFAVGVGYGLARLVRKKPEDPPAES